MNRRRLLAKLASGAFRNVAFRDAALVEGFGFVLSRTEGSHHIYKHGSVDELVNLQDVHGEAKPYQLRQILRLVERYDLKLGDDQ